MSKSKGISLLYSLLALAFLCCAFLILLLFKSNKDSNKNSSPVFSSTGQNSFASPALLRDSLKQAFSTAVTGLSNQMDSGIKYDPVLKSAIEERINVLNNLQQEIGGLLKSNSSIEDLEKAKTKIAELQQLVNQLQQRTQNTEKENARLYALLKRYVDENKAGATTSAPPATTTQRNPAPRQGSAQVVAISDIRVSSQNEEREETSRAEETNQLVVSCELKNYNQQNPNAEMQVVVLKPDGKVFKNNEWEMGAFETLSGRKIYSYKTKLEVNKGESKKLQFTLEGTDYPKGNYHIQFYHQGVLVAKASKILS